MRQVFTMLFMTACIGWAYSPAARSQEPTTEIAAAADAQAATELEEPSEPLTPVKPRSAEEQNQLDALALFAAGRMKEQQQDFPGALKLYQRALREDPTALPILELIVPLAFTLNRQDEAVRYALMAMELDSSNAILLRRLAMELTDQDDYAGALKLYQKARAAEADDEKSAASVVLSMEMGRLYFLTGEHRLAADNFAMVAEALENPEAYKLDAELTKELLKDPTELYEMFAEAYLKADRHADALAAFEKAFPGEENAAVLAFQRARLLAESEPDKALAELETYFSAKGASRGAQPYELLGKVLEKLGKQDELLPRLIELRKADEANVPLGYHLAERLRLADRLAESQEFFVQLAKDSPAPQGYEGLAYIYRKTDRPEALLQLLGESAAQTGGFETLGEEAKTLLADAALVNRLIELAKASQDQDEDAKYGTSLAGALLAMEIKQYDAAGELYNRAIEVRPANTAELLMGWGIGLLMADQYTEAAGVFQRAIDAAVLPAENPAFHYYLAGALELAGQTEPALAAARHAVSVQEDSPRLVSRLAWILYHAKRYDEAIESYLKLIEKFDAARHAPDLARENRAELGRIVREARLVLSNIYVIQNKVPLAEEWLEQVLDEYPEDISALNDLGYLWADQNKNLDRALEMVKKAVASEPENAAYRDSLGWVLYRLGRFEEALGELKLAAGVEKPDGVILEHLGDVLAAMKNGQGAREAWERALSVLDSAQEAEKIKAIQDKLKQLAERQPAEAPAKTTPGAP